MSVMAAFELDPIFVKALSLLRSRSKDSTEQLKALLDDALAGTSRNRSSKASETEGNKKSGAKQKEDKMPTPCIKLAASEGSRKEAERRAEKRAGEKQKQSKTDTSDSLDPPQSKKTRSEKQRRPVIEEEDDENVEAESADTEDSSKDDSNQESTDADDFALELGLACIVCKQLDVSAGNQLIECQECHSLYHQLCHKPPASEADPNDPRLVWYCSKCTRSMKKQVSKKLKGSSSSATTTKDTIQKDVEAKSDQEPVLNLFKRTEPKSTSSSASVSSSSKTPYTGLASLAANLSKPSTSTRSNVTSSRPSSVSSKPGSKVSPIPSPVTKTAPSTSAKSQVKSGAGGHAGKNVPQTSTASAMKRLQQMKKKASSKR